MAPRKAYPAVEKRKWTDLEEAASIPFQVTSATKTKPLTVKTAPPRTVLLYGRPGTGKSLLARTAGNPDEVFCVPFHADTPASELRGHPWPTEEGGFKFMYGPAIEAWRLSHKKPVRLVLDEIDRASDDALSFCLAVLDNPETARITIPRFPLETLTPGPYLTVWATMNGMPEDLEPALADRFPVRQRINFPHPDALALVDEDIRPLVEGTYHAPENEVGINDMVTLRQGLEFTALRKRVGDDVASRLIFEERAKNVLNTIQLARVADPR